MDKKQKTILGVSLTIIITVSIGVGILFTTQPPWFVEMLVESQLDAQNQFPEIDDGLHALLLGTGSPMPDENRVGPATMVIAGSKHFVVDAGSGSTRNIALSGLSAGEIDAAFLTHFHSDHIADLGELMLQRWTLGGHNESLPVYGPVGVTTVVEGFNQAYQSDSTYRTGHHGEENIPINGSGGVAHEYDIGNSSLASQVIYEQDGVRVTMFNVNHIPVYPAVGYRFDYGGRSLVLSGDTLYSENLEIHATDVDLLICEALNAELVGFMEDQAAEGNINGDTTEVILHDIVDYHMTPEDAARLAQNANVSYLVYHHMIPPLPDGAIVEGIFLGDAPQIYSGLIEVGNDGLLISMPANTNLFTSRNLLLQSAPLPALIVIPVSILLLALLFGVGWMITKNKQLKAQTIIPVIAILMGFLVLTRIVTFIVTGFAMETLIQAAVEAIILTWSILLFKQNRTESVTHRAEEVADQSLVN